MKTSQIYIVGQDESMHVEIYCVRSVTADLLGKAPQWLLGQKLGSFDGVGGGKGPGGGEERKKIMFDVTQQL